MKENFADPSFVPIILGTDIGAYALARSFHEAYSVTPILVTQVVYGPIRHSKILRIEYVPGDSNDSADIRSALIDGLLELGPRLQQEFPGKKLVMIANLDSNIWDMMLHQDELREYYEFAIPSPELLAGTNSKTSFPKLAERFGLRVPPTLEIDLDSTPEDIQSLLDDFDHPLPWILKPTMGYGYERLKWPGKAKVYTLNSREELTQLLHSLEEHTRPYSHARSYVLQPRVDGNDSYNLSITAYVDRHHRVTMIGSARVILEDHTPSALGNPVAMVTEVYPGLYEQVTRFLEGCGWWGFANFDVKVDKRCGVAYFFEVNPRIGRNSYYNTAAGLNPMPFMVADLVDEAKLERREMVPGRPVFYTILPPRLVARYCDSRLAKQLQALRRAGHMVDPLWNQAEWDWSCKAWRRFAYLVAARENHWRKYHWYYPRRVFLAQGGESYDTTAQRNGGH